MHRPAPIALLAAAALLAACGRSDGQKPLVATADSVTSTTKTTSSPPPTPIDTTKPPLFTYQEERVGTLTYWSSGALRVVVTHAADASHACESALGEGDNMWTRSDVDAAFHDPDVQAALARKAFYASAYPEAAELVAHEGKIEWWNSWDKPPPPEPKAVGHLHQVLHVVLENRVTLCP